MKKLALLIIIISLAVSCKSTEGSRKKGSTSTIATTSKKISANDARVAILRAEAINARQYAREEMQVADEMLALTLKQEKDRDRVAQAKLTIEKADSAYEKSLPLYKKEMSIELKEVLVALQANEVDFFASDSYQIIQQQVRGAENILLADDIVAFQTSYDRIIQNSQQLTRAVMRNKERVAYLRDQTAADMVVSRIESRELKVLLMSGTEKEAEYNLESAYGYYRQAAQLLRQLKISNDQYQALNALEKEMRRVQREIEGASKLFVIGEKGERIYPSQWSGNSYLERHPLPSFIDQGDDSSNLMVEPLDHYNIVTMMVGDDAWVAADINGMGLYQKAIELWQEGVGARNEGDLDAASNYFEKSMEHIIEFKRGSVAKIYVVKYNPSLRDCLWRIASFKDIYDNQYLWPLLWQRNQAQITNPDLIYPGQELLVPPLLD